MCNSTDRKRFADDYQTFFDECYLLNDRLALVLDRYTSSLSYLQNVFNSMDHADFYSTAEKKKFVAELISSIKECQSCVSKLSVKTQQLNELSDDDYKKSSVG